MRVQGWIHVSRVLGGLNCDDLREAVRIVVDDTDLPDLPTYMEVFEIVESNLLAQGI